MQRIAVLLLCAGIWSSKAVADPCDQVGAVVGGFAGGVAGYGVVGTFGAATNWVTAGLYGAGIAVATVAGRYGGEVGCDRFQENFDAIGEMYCRYSGFDYDCGAVQTMTRSLYGDFVVCPSCSWDEVFSVFFLDDESRENWLQRIQVGRTGYYAPVMTVIPRDHVGSLGSASTSMSAYYLGLQAGFAALRTTSMYVMRD